ncbi:MAG: TolB family protein [Acidimicrobiia bacterium]
MRLPLAGAIAVAGLLTLTTPALAGDQGAGHDGPGTCPTPSCDVAVAATTDGQLLLLDAASGGVWGHLDHNRPPTSSDRGAPIDAISLTPSRDEVYYAAKDWSDGGRDILAVGIDGNGRRLVVEDAASPAVSPDGRFLAYSFSPDPDSGRTSIAIRELATGTERTFGPGADPDMVLGAVSDIAWSPDSTRLAFTHDYEGTELWLLDLLSGTSDFSGARDLGPYRSPSWNNEGLFATEWSDERRGLVARLDPAAGGFTPYNTEGGLSLDEAEVYGVDVRDNWGTDLLVVRGANLEGGSAGRSGALDRVDATGAIRRLGAGYAVAAW